MKTNAAQLAAGLALVAFGAPFRASGQYFPPPLIVVPPPAQEYATPKPVPNPARPRPKTPADTPPPPQTKPGGHYEGRTFVPD